MECRYDILKFTYTYSSFIDRHCILCADLDSQAGNAQSCPGHGRNTFPDSDRKCYTL